jgi:hypothetical protein
LEVGPGSASAPGRKVVDVLDAWIDQNLDTWAPSSARDQQSRMRSIKQDKIADIPIAQLSIADVERWHTRLRRAGLQDAGIRNQHGALSAALNQAVRWGWASRNVASLAQRKTIKKPPRGVMSLDDVRAVIAAADEFDPAAALALRLAAMTGARRAELAALRWTDVDDGMLTIDSAIEVIRHPGAARELSDAPTKTGNACSRCSLRSESPSRACSSLRSLFNFQTGARAGLSDHLHQRSDRPVDHRTLDARGFPTLNPRSTMARCSGWVTTNCSRSSRFSGEGPSTP